MSSNGRIDKIEKELAKQEAPAKASPDHFELTAAPAGGV